MSRTIDNGKEEKLAAERKKKAQEQKHTELTKEFERVENEKRVTEEENKRQAQTINDMQKVIHEKKAELTDLLGRHNKLDRENEKLKKEDQNRGKMMLESENARMTAERDSKKANRENTQLELDKKRLTESKAAAMQEKQASMNAVNALTREIEWLRKQTEVEQQGIMKLIRDRNMLKKNLTKIEDTNNENKSLLIQKDQLIKGLEESVNTYKEHIAQLIKQIENVEKERDALSQQANKANANLMQMVEEVKLKKNLIGELKKENIEFESKLKQQQNLYEVVRSDRNLYGKNLIEANDEVIELRKKFKIAQYQIA